MQLDKQDWGCVYVIMYEEEVIYVGSTKRTPGHRLSQFFAAAKIGTKSSNMLRFIREHQDTSKYRAVVVKYCENYLEEEGKLMQKLGFLKILNQSPNPSGNSSIENRTRYWAGKRPDAAIAASVAARKGKPLSEEHKAKCAKNTARAVLCVTTGQTFKSATEAARVLGIKSVSISKNCLGLLKTYKNMTFKYIEDSNG